MISVVIPAHNAGAFLAETLESVYAQTVREPVEVVVYNDGSSDDTDEICASFADRGLKVLGQNKPGGANHARNAAVEASTGEFLAFLDADDVWLPGKLADQLAVLQKQTVPSLVFGQLQEFDAEGPRGEFQGCCLTSLFFSHRSTFDRVGPLDTTLRLGDFAEWLSRAQDLGIPIIVPEIPMARRRHHSTNMGKRLVDCRADYLEVVRRRLARRRAGD